MVVAAMACRSVPRRQVNRSEGVWGRGSKFDVAICLTLCQRHLLLLLPGKVACSVTTPVPASTVLSVLGCCCDIT
jgi:hypothetical protein